MKNSITPACLPATQRFDIKDTLKVNIEITNNPLDLPLDCLLAMAARINPKRSFLFVSKLLGKHIAVDPHIPQLAGMALAAILNKEAYDNALLQNLREAFLFPDNASRYATLLTNERLTLGAPTVFIGFAETATALGHSMFESFKTDAYFFHTTREEIVGMESLIDFDEEHSHAVAHRCYLKDHFILNNNYPIVLVDDELTTGKTARNIIRDIQMKFPRTKYVVASLLDWRSENDKSKFKELEQELGIEVNVISLLSGLVSFSGEAIHNHETIQSKPRDLNPTWFRNVHFDGIPQVGVSSADSEDRINASPYLYATGRFGLTSSQNDEMEAQLQKIGRILRDMRESCRTLCLGTSEFIHVPMKIAAGMGMGVKYQSTTRSPIQPSSEQGYAIQSKIPYPSPDDRNIQHFLYNIDASLYDEVFVFFERQYGHDQLEGIKLALQQTGIRHIVLVDFLN